MKYLFEETQKFRQWWLWLILIYFPFAAIFISTPINYNYVFIGLAIPAIFSLFQLRVKVNENGLHYQFFPIHLKAHIIKAEEIDKIEALQYRPIAEYGGWGIRYGFKGKAYNVSGNLGVKIYLKNGKNLLFGSQKHKELAKALKQIKRE